MEWWDLVKAGAVLLGMYFVFAAALGAATFILVLLIQRWIK